MVTTFQVIALSSLDVDGSDTRDEPRLLFSDALKTARELKSQGKAFRVIADADETQQETQLFSDLGALR